MPPGWRSTPTRAACTPAHGGVRVREVHDGAQHVIVAEEIGVGRHAGVGGKCRGRVRVWCGIGVRGGAGCGNASHGAGGRGGGGVGCRQVGCGDYRHGGDACVRHRCEHAPCHWHLERSASVANPASVRARGLLSLPTVPSRCASARWRSSVSRNRVSLCLCNTDIALESSSCLHQALCSSCQLVLGCTRRAHNGAHEAHKRTTPRALCCHDRSLPVCYRHAPLYGHKRRSARANRALTAGPNENLNVCQARRRDGVATVQQRWRPALLRQHLPVLMSALAASTALAPSRGFR